MSSATRSPAADNSGAPDALVAELMQYPPFTQMQGEHLQYFIDQAQTAHYSAGTAILSPSAEVPAHLLLVRKGHVTRQARAEAEGGIEYEAGDLFPIGTVMAGRPVDGRYDAHDDVDCLLLPLAQVRELCRISPPFAEFMQGRVRAQLQLSRQAMQASMAAQSLAEQSLEARLGDLALKTPISVAPETPLAQALATMHERKIGSMLVLDAKGAALGILTRHDMLDRVVLATRCARATSWPATRIAALRQRNGARVSTAGWSTARRRICSTPTFISIDTETVDGREMVDLKHHGTAVFVDVSRIYALALGVAQTGTRERIEAIGPLLHMSSQDSEAWIAAFEYLQMLRLQVQMSDTPLAQANLVAFDGLNHIDRHILKESFRTARRLLSKIGRDYPS